MTDYLGGAALAVGIVLIGAAYVLLGQLQRLKTWIEQMAAALGVRLSAVPSKSAPRTDGSGEKPRRWWTKLILEEEDAPPEPERPRPTPHPRSPGPAMAAITPEAVTGLIDDRDLAHTYAAIENNFRNWRASLAERGSK